MATLTMPLSVINFLLMPSSYWSMRIKHWPMRIEQCPMRREHCPMRIEYCPMRIEHCPMRREHWPMRSIKNLNFCFNFDLIWIAFFFSRIPENPEPFWRWPRKNNSKLAEQSFWRNTNIRIEKLNISKEKNKEKRRVRFSSKTKNQ